MKIKIRWLDAFAMLGFTAAVMVFITLMLNGYSL